MLAFVDVETTGLDPDVHEIIQVAILVESQTTNQVVMGFETKVKPQNLEVADPKALELNGYQNHPEWWDSAPVMNEELAAVIASYLKNAIMVGQNVGFDKGFLQKALKKYDMWDWIGHHTVDTASMAIEHLGPLGVSSVSLKNTCKVLGIPNENEHDAMADVRRCRAVYHKLKRAGFLKRLWWGIKIFMGDKRNKK
jgi:DNA polymerase-3 subunit epsilon